MISPSSVKHPMLFSGIMFLRHRPLFSQKTHLPLKMWKGKSLSRVQLFMTPWPPWNSLEVGSSFLLQAICPNQGSNPGLPNCRWVLYQLSHKGSPRILLWVAYHFLRGSSWPRNWTGVSCTAGTFLTSWVMTWHQTPSWEEIQCCLLCSYTKNDEECYKDKYCLKFLDLCTQNNTQEPLSMSLVDFPPLPFSLPFQASPMHLKPSQT